LCNRPTAANQQGEANAGLTWDGIEGHPPAAKTPAMAGDG